MGKKYTKIICVMFKHEEIYGGDTWGADITQKEMDTGGSEEWREAEILSFFFIGIVSLVLVQMHYFCNFTNRRGTQ